MLVVAAGAGEQADRLGAVAAKNQDERAALCGDFDVNLQIVESGDDGGQIAGAAMFVVIREKARRAIAVVDHFVTRFCRRSTKPAARSAAGAFSVPGANAAALEGAPIRAIFFG